MNLFRKPATVTAVAVEERKDLAEKIESAIHHAYDGRCYSCFRHEATEAELAEWDRIDPEGKLPDEAYANICFEHFFGVCTRDPDNNLNEERLYTLAVLKVLADKGLVSA